MWLYGYVLYRDINFVFRTIMASLEPIFRDLIEYTLIEN